MSDACLDSRTRTIRATTYTAIFARFTSCTRKAIFRHVTRLALGYPNLCSPQLPRIRKPKLDGGGGLRKETIAAMRRNARCADSGPSCRHSQTGRFDLNQTHRRKVIRGNPYSI